MIALILYSANIRGDLDLLPRLYTLIRRLKTQPVAESDDVMLCPVEPPIPDPPQPSPDPGAPPVPPIPEPEPV